MLVQEAAAYIGTLICLAQRLSFTTEQKLTSEVYERHIVGGAVFDSFSLSLYISARLK